MGFAREDEYNEFTDLPDEGLSLEELVAQMEASSREAARLHKLYLKTLSEQHSRVPDPGWDNFTFDVRFKGNRRTYHYTARRMPTGAIYTTATTDNWFSSWEVFVRWLRQDDKTYVSPLTKLSPTRLTAVVR